MRAPLVRAVGAAALTLALAAPALAHRVNVFASVEENTVTVEARFSTGRVPAVGEVSVEDAAGATVASFPLGEGGVAQFSLAGLPWEDGLAITVRTGDDHEGYWLLTPADIAGSGGEE
jgi:nickel transport protein